MEIREELRLVRRAKSGDREAVALLWDDITPKLYGYLVNQLRQKDLAEDICQQTWLKAIAKLDTFTDRGVRFSAWLFAIARNECRQHWRNGSKDIPIDETIEETHAYQGHDSTEDLLLIETAFAQVSVEEQEILRLRYLVELSFKEIASVLGISMIAARVRAHRALAHARLVLTK